MFFKLAVSNGKGMSDKIIVIIFNLKCEFDMNLI
jgi:hypothetical protein